MSTLIVDYGMCNLGSVFRAFEECDARNLKISNDPRDLRSASRIILPGVGAFNEGMKNLNLGGWIEPLTQAVVNDRIPLLGICLGMQLLAEKGIEGGETKGLGFIPGEVRRMELGTQFRVPHVGWNEIHRVKDSKFLNEIADGTDFYFVHSFHFLAKEKEVVLAQTPYGEKFVSAVEKNNIVGVQFHPEKSQKPGFQLIRNFLEN